MSKTSKIIRKFERGFLPHTIGMTEEQKDEFYRRPRDIDTTGWKVIGTGFDDFENQREIFVSNIHGTVNINTVTVFPKNKMDIADDHPLAREVWQKDGTFALNFLHMSRDPISITAEDDQIHINGKPYAEKKKEELKP